MNLQAFLEKHRDYYLIAYGDRIFIETKIGWSTEQEIEKLKSVGYEFNGSSFSKKQYRVEQSQNFIILNKADCERFEILCEFFTKDSRFSLLMFNQGMDQILFGVSGPTLKVEKFAQLCKEFILMSQDQRDRYEYKKI